MLTIKVTISPATAIKNGRANAGTFDVQIDDTFVAGLSDLKREILLRCVQNGAPCVVAGPNGQHLPTPDLAAHDADALRAWITAAAQLVQAARDEAEQAQQTRRQVEAQALAAGMALGVDAWIARSESDTYVGPRAQFHFQAPEVAEKYSFMGHGEYAAFLARVNARIQELRQAEEARMAPLFDAHRAKEVEEKRERQAAIRAFLEAHSTDASQLARFDEHFLPEKELLHVVRGHVFAPLKEFGRFVRLTAKDAKHHEDCDRDPDYVSFEKLHADELTSDEYGKLVALRDAARDIPECTVQACEHTVECRAERCPGPVSRRSALVTVEWHGHKLSREYAL